jgi:uncharacterized protein
MKKQYFLLILLAGLIAFASCKKESAYKTLIITGQSVHDWKISSASLKQILDNSGMFNCEIITSPEKGGDMSAFNPDFSMYKLVVLDYDGDSWNEKTNAGFIDYVENGGGVVIYHESNNAFPLWKEYNEITGLGGWGNRTEKDGPYMYFKGNKLIVDTAAGPGGSHGKRREFMVRTRLADHPITKGLPVRWMHGSDELYGQLRGPGKNMEILASAFSDTTGGGTMRDEPMLMTIKYGKGRIFHTVMGHPDVAGGPAMQCTGFIVTLQRGAEWAVTGEVTQPVPFDFPNTAGVVLRPDFREITLEEAISGIGSYNITQSTKNLSFIQNYIRNASGDKQQLSKLEQMMDNVLADKNATIDSKKIILRELSWMGTDKSAAAIKGLIQDENLKDEAEFALARLQGIK